VKAAVATEDCSQWRKIVHNAAKIVAKLVEIYVLFCLEKTVVKGIIGGSSKGNGGPFTMEEDCP